LAASSPMRPGGVFTLGRKSSTLQEVTAKNNVSVFPGAREHKGHSYSCNKQETSG
jgi:hypothetical protein